jgi:Mg/Co/Ni transporter MgtE
MLFPKRAAAGVAVVLFVIIVVANILKSQLNPLYFVTRAFEPAHAQTPLLTHVVLFQFKKGVSQTAIKEA